MENTNSYEYANHPSHYNDYDVEVLEMMRRIWGDDEVKIFCKLSAFKYRMRMGLKPNEPIERDIEKERTYLNKLKELSKETIPDVTWYQSTITDGHPHENGIEKILLKD